MMGWCDECSEETNLMNGCAKCGAIVCPKCEYRHDCPNRANDDEDEE